MTFVIMLLFLSNKPCLDVELLTVDLRYPDLFFLPVFPPTFKKDV